MSRFVTVLWWIIIPLDSALIVVSVHRGMFDGDWDHCWNIPFFVAGILLASSARNILTSKEGSCQ